MRWAFWRSRSAAPPEPPRPLPEDVGLPTTPRPPAAPGDPEQEEPERQAPPRSSARPTSVATPTADSRTQDDAPPTAAAELDRTDLAAAGRDVARLVGARRSGGEQDRHRADPRVLAAAATGALAARLPALSGVDGAVAFDEPADELLHAYADLLVGRAVQRRTAAAAAREDLLAVAHLAAAAAAVDAAADPALLLAGMPAAGQLRAAALLLAQTADDGGGAPDRLEREIALLFGASG